MGGGEKQNKCKRGSRANKLQPKLLGGLGPPSESILGGTEICICTFPSI